MLTLTYSCGSITSSTSSGNREPSFSSSGTSSGSSTAAAIVEGGPLSAIAAALPLALAVPTESHHSAAVVLAVEVAQQPQLLKWH